MKRSGEVRRGTAVDFFRARRGFAGLLFLVVASSLAFAQANNTEVRFLHDSGKKEWCAFSKAAAWTASVDESQSTTVGALIFSNGHVSQIGVTTENDLSAGDWIVYDRYFLDDRGQITKLSRLINVLPGNQSVSETYSISGGKAIKTVTTAKDLDSGKPLASPRPLWRPILSVKTATKDFPFSALLGLPDLTTTAKSCVADP